jgi:hypothetical protein
MRPLLILSFYLSFHPLFCQTELYTITQADDGLFHLYYDSSTAKSSIVEFEKYIVLLEVPIKNDGGGAQNLKDHVYGGKKVLATLKNYFPTKPLKYVMHTHWHPHSLSSITPFLSNGVTLVTTRSNLKKIKTFADSTTINKFKKQLLIVETDSLVIKDKVNKIVMHRFLQKDYPNTPTSEYLYFFLPKYSALHTGCMYNRWKGEPIDGRELLTSREEDIQKFLLSKNLKPLCLLRGSGDTDEPNGMIAFSKFDHVINHGISAADIIKKYFTLTDQQLEARKDSIINTIKQNNIPISFVNSAVYAALRNKQLTRALHLAQINLALNPEDPNGWDTLGEVYYFMDDVELARIHEHQCKRISPTFNQGGEKTWKVNLAQFKQQWK